MKPLTAVLTIAIAAILATTGLTIARASFTDNAASTRIVNCPPDQCDPAISIN